MCWWHRTVSLALILLLGSLLLSSFSVEAKSLPTRIGECRETRITQITTRWGGTLTYEQDHSDSGSFVRFNNGGTQISFSKIEELVRSRVGDRVRMCLLSIPTLCPPGDDRGRSYRTTNLRTGESWTLPDDTRVCGGA
jgi:hypothetical protein